jgi:hypothetical protein
MKSFSPLRSSRVRVVAAAVASLAAVAVIPTFASGASSGTPPPPGATVGVVNIVLKHGLPKFVAPATIHTGDYLEIDNKTDPHAIGPHTFSLVQPAFIPKTKHARKACFSKGHICRSVFKWHQATRNSIGLNPVEAGLAGWDTEGSTSVTGDSWVAQKKNDTFVQAVTAAPGSTLTFMCAIHPFMHGKITVLAPGT